MTVPPVTPAHALAEARQVCRRFGAFRAVDETDLAVGQGEVVGLLGANGAGKTTLIRLLLGLLRPTGGTVRLFGSAPSVAGRRRVGYVPQTLGLYADLTVAENWRFTAAAFGTAGTAMPEDIGGWRDELVGALPLGAQRQVAFAVALAHRPELLVLDEPTSGVGPLGRARLWEQIRRAADLGGGVLVTTHNMEEAQECDRLVVMADGRVAASGTTAEIIGGRTVAQVRCRDWSRAFALLDGKGFMVQAQGGTPSGGADRGGLRSGGVQGGGVQGGGVQGGGVQGSGVDGGGVDGGVVLRVAGDVGQVAGLLSREGLDADVDVAGADLDEAFVAIVTAGARPGAGAGAGPGGGGPAATGRSGAGQT